MRLPLVSAGSYLLATLTVPGTAVSQMTAPNPYRMPGDAWGQLPGGRAWGATSGIGTAPDGRSIWVAERCGANQCAGSPHDPILLFDSTGRAVRQFGAGLFAWPHGLHVDREGNVWVTDASGFGEPSPGLGHVVYKFSAEGELLMTLGEKGVPGRGPGHFRKPSAVLVAPGGEIFIADGHDAEGNNRIVKLAPDGSFLLQWGDTGSEAGQFRDPHALAMDSAGRLFVADRGNSRIQIFDQDGRHLATWTQFGRPSGLFIDGDDLLYAVDSESNARRNPGWRRGLYVGSARTGWVTAFLPDPEPDPDGSATSFAEGVTVDAGGRVYGAEVGSRSVRRYVRRVP